MLSVLALLIIILNIQLVQGSEDEKSKNSQSLDTTPLVKKRKLVEACYSKDKKSTNIKVMLWNTLRKWELLP